MTTSFKSLDRDVFADGDPGITFTEDDQTWTILPGILVSSSHGGGVFSQLLDRSALFNNGTILSSASGEVGVELNGTNSSISNAAGAGIIAAGVGVFVGGKTSTIDNHGSIRGLAGAGVDFGFNSDHVTLNNSGSIYGRNDGVVAFSHVDGGIIHNAGLIASDHVGIEVQVGEGTTTIIDNAVGGTIRGVEQSVSVDSGRIALTNRGTLIGNIDMDSDRAEKDVIVNHGKIKGHVALADGNDVFTGSGGTSGAVDGQDGDDRLTGGNAADLLFGGRGNDRLAGAGGNDQLDGELGLDTLIGGSGKDRFIFDSGLDAALNVDRITDFTVHVDKIVLDHRIFAGAGAPGLLAAARFHVGAAAADASDRVIYNPNSGFLFYDADGKGGSGEVHFATVAAHLALHSNDFLVAALLAA